MERYFLEPYRFIPPFRSTFWVRMARGMIARNLRRHQGVVRFHIEGVEAFHQSRLQNAGIVLAANHTRWADPMVLGVVCASFKQYLYYVASYHLFRQSRFLGWVMNRLGGYSIWREGADRESIKATAQILADADRPVVIFPEGTWFRQNDRVAMLQDGLSLITRQAARQSNRPIVIHPVGIKYWLLEDPSRVIQQRLLALERRLGWHPQTHLDVFDRIEKLGGALLALKEVEFLGTVQGGDLDARVRRLAESQVERLEKHYLGKFYEGWLLERVRRVRQYLIRQLLDHGKDTDRSAQYRLDLDVLLFCENLNAQSMEYLRENPSPERIVETIQRIEETITDSTEVPFVPMGVTVRFGEAIDVRSLTGNERRGGPDPLVQNLRKAMQEQLDRCNDQGPPPEWGCPRQRLVLPGTTSSADTQPVTSVSSLEDAQLVR